MSVAVFAASISATLSRLPPFLAQRAFRYQFLCHHQRPFCFFWSLAHCKRSFWDHLRLFGLGWFSTHFRGISSQRLSIKSNEDVPLIILWVLPHLVSAAMPEAP